MQNSDKFWNIIDNADSFSVRGNFEKNEFGWAAQVNQAFAVELYLKSIMEFEKGEIEQGHNLKTLFKHLDNKTQDAIYNNWRTLSGENIPNNKQIKTWFKDNLYACCNTFMDFRYIFERDSNRVSLETSWDIDQFNQLSIFSTKHEFGRLQVYSSFLKEFKNAVKKYIRESVVPKLPPRSYNIMMSMNISIEIERPDTSIKTEHDKVVLPINISNDDK